MKSLTSLSYGKVNLSLDVFKKGIPPSPLHSEYCLGKREINNENNFHTVKTIFHKISLADEIEVTENNTFEIIGNFSCKMEDNLIFKAFNLVKKYIKDTPNVRIEIIKNIPEKAGLGGGSSNFATFVRMYFELFGLGDIPQELIQESGNYGKDIPFFFSDSPCMIGENFGEEISPTPFPGSQFSGTPIWIYKPPFENCTKTMYQKLSVYENGYTEKFLKSLDLKDCGNTFDEFLKEPEYQNILHGVDAKKTHLCGSGSSFFSFEKLGPIDCKEIIVTLL